MGLTMKEKKAVALEIAKRYRKVSKKEKGIILNEFVELTGYNRSYASHILHLQGKRLYLKPKTILIGDLRKKAKRKRKRIYDQEVKKPLLLVWRILNYPCSRKLEAALKETVPRLVHFKELSLSSETERKLKRISSSTIDRIFKEERKRYRLKGRKLTRPGSLLKNQIRIRTFSEC